MRSLASQAAACCAILILLCGTAFAVPMTVRLQGGFADQSYTFTYGNGDHDDITVNASVDLVFTPSQPGCNTTYMSSSSALVNGTIRVWGEATQYRPHSTVTRIFDDTKEWIDVPDRPVDVYYEGETGAGGVLYLAWPITGTADPEKATPYALRYDIAAHQMRLWVALPSPFWYDEADEYYDTTGATTVSGQASVKSCLHGAVTDTVTKQPVSGADVRFGNIPSTSDAAGTFHYTVIPANTYQLIASKTGYGATTNILTIQAFKIEHTEIELRSMRELQGIEITQCVQNWNNDVPLVEGKSTYLVAHIWSTLQSDHNYPGLPLTVLFSSGDRTGSCIRNFPGIPYRDKPPLPPTGYDRAQDHSIIIPIDKELCHGDLKVILAAKGLVPKAGFAGTVNANGNPEITVHFDKAPAIKVRPVLFTWTDDGQTHTTDCSTAHRALDTLRKTLPSDIVLVTPFETPVRCDDGLWLMRALGTPHTDEDMLNLCWKLGWIRLLEGVFREPEDRVYYVGLLDGVMSATRHSSPDELVLGKAPDIPGNCCVAYFPSQNDDLLVVSHEFSHCLGRHHDRSVTADEYRDFNNPGTVSYNQAKDANDTYFGLDTIRNAAKPSIVSCEMADIMSYKHNARWPSAYTFKNEYLYLLPYAFDLLEKADVSFGFDKAGGLSDSVMLVHGTVSLNPIGGKILGISRAPGSSLPSAPVGTWSISMKDGTGTVILSYPFVPLFGDAGGMNGVFTLAVPLSSATRRVDLLCNGTVVDTVVASAHTPQVVMMQPAGGVWTNSPLAVQWRATDDDSSHLSFDVLFTGDNGLNWSVLALGITNQTLLLSADTLPGTTQALFRVLASDGFNTAETQSVSPGILSVKPPSVTIISPVNLQVLSGPIAILLNAIAYDLQEGELTTNNVVWRSNRNGVMGTGTVLNVSAALLSEGEHTITVDAVGKTGLHTTQAVTITIVRDANLNGIPDWWETFYFGSSVGAAATQDSDGDGLNNLEEYLCGTHPKSAASCLRLTGLASLRSAGFHLHWDAVTGKQYRVEWNDSITGAWSTTQCAYVGATNAWRDPGSIYHSKRFYRIALQTDPWAISADRDLDGVPDDWAILYGLNPGDPATAAADSDGDGQSNLGEFLSGTNPRDPNSSLRVTGLRCGALSGYEVRWDSVTGKTYRVSWTPALGATWTSANSVFVGSTNRWIDTGASGVKARFYRVSVE